VVEEGSPDTLYQSPTKAFTARFLAGANVVTDPVLAEALAGEARPDGCDLAVAPRDLVADDAGVPARVVGRLFQGTHVEWTLRVDGDAGSSELRAWGHPDAPPAAAVRAVASRWVHD
jgi:hypothetical protein